MLRAPATSLWRMSRRARFSRAGESSDTSRARSATAAGFGSTTTTVCILCVTCISTGGFVVDDTFLELSFLCAFFKMDSLDFSASDNSVEFTAAIVFTVDERDVCESACVGLFTGVLTSLPFPGTADDELARRYCRGTRVRAVWASGVSTGHTQT